MERGEMIHKVGNRVWFRCGVNILEKTDEYIAFKICRDTPTLRAADKKGNALRLGCDDWILQKKVWVNNNLTYLFPYSDYIGYGILTDEDNRFISYYLNFQDQTSVKGNTITTLDYELDFVVNDFEKREYVWKDISEFEKLRDMGFFKSSIFDDFEYDEKRMFSKLEKYKSKLDYLSTL